MLTKLERLQQAVVDAEAAYDVAYAAAASAADHAADRAAFNAAYAKARDELSNYLKEQQDND